MPFHLLGAPPHLHVLPILLSSALAFAAGAYLMTRRALPASVAEFREVLRKRIAALRDAPSPDAQAPHMFADAMGTTGHSAFDAYRSQTLKTLEAEASEFSAYLDGLRRTRDEAEFEAFLENRRAAGGPSGCGTE